MTSLYFVNRFILQFACIRLTRHTEHIIDKIDYFECSLIGPGEYGMGGNILASHYEQYYSIQYWVVPFTGWSTEYKHFNTKVKYLRLTSNKIVK